MPSAGKPSAGKHTADPMFALKRKRFELFLKGLNLFIL
jgi:hypothetical protein